MGSDEGLILSVLAARGPRQIGDKNMLFGQQEPESQRHLLEGHLALFLPSFLKCRFNQSSPVDGVVRRRCESVGIETPRLKLLIMLEKANLQDTGKGHESNVPGSACLSVENRPTTSGNEHQRSKYPRFHRSGLAPRSRRLGR